MSLLRTYEANELQLQRFIGELGFVEITDWYVQNQHDQHDLKSLLADPSRNRGRAGNTTQVAQD